jgi:hypothetical protein
MFTLKKSHSQKAEQPKPVSYSDAVFRFSSELRGVEKAPLFSRKRALGESITGAKGAQTRLGLEKFRASVAKEYGLEPNDAPGQGTDAFYAKILEGMIASAELAFAGKTLNVKGSVQRISSWKHGASYIVTEIENAAGRDAMIELFKAQGLEIKEGRFVAATDIPKP